MRLSWFLGNLRKPLLLLLLRVVMRGKMWNCLKSAQWCIYALIGNGIKHVKTCEEKACIFTALQRCKSNANETESTTEMSAHVIACEYLVVFCCELNSFCYLSPTVNVSTLRPLLQMFVSS